MTSQLKCVLRLEENVSRAVSQKPLTLYGEQNSLTPFGKKNNLKFGLARDQVVFLETAGNLLAGRRKANNSFAVFSSFVLEGVTKHLMTSPARNSELFSTRP